MTNGDVKLGWADRKRQWTVMVYMAAENSSELDAVAVEDMREMERGANDNVHVAVQINRAWPPVPQRYEIRTSGPNEFLNEDRELTNMGKAETLAGFLKWAVREFPAHNYCLVLWGHAYGLGFGRDHNEPLTLKDLTDALKKFRAERENYDSAKSGEPGGRLELLGANACAMSYVEAAYQLRDHAQYMVASQIAVPYAGWPYELILRRIADKPDSKTLGEIIVDAYASHFNGLIAGERVTMSLLNLGAMSHDLTTVPEDLPEVTALTGVRDFKDLIEQFAVALQTESRLEGPFSDKRGYVRDVFIAAASGDVRPLIDLEDLCQDFEDADSPNLQSVAWKVLKFLPRLVIRHKGHSELVEELHGVGIFAPFVTDDEDLKRLELDDNHRDDKADPELGRQIYENLALFGGQSTWPRLVYDELRQSAPSELLTCLTGLGASRREDRRDITQIVLAIESSFNKLDRVLAEGKRRIQEELDPPEASDAKHIGPGNGAGGKRFASPYLKLIRQSDVDAQMATLKRLQKALELAAAVPVGIGTDHAISAEAIVRPSIELLKSHPELLDAMRGADPKLVDAAVGIFAKIEKAVGEVERATRKGLTHARLGIGPSAPDRFTFAEDPKTTTHGFAEDPKTTTHGLAEDPKTTTHGFIEDPKTTTHGGNGFQGGARDLRVDLAFARVVDLFGRVGQALRQVEDATSELENTARAVFSNGQGQSLTGPEMLKAAAAGIRRALEIVEESSKNARRTIRGVFSHPVYGLGPASGAIGLEERQALANAGGLSRRNLRLL